MDDHSRAVWKAVSEAQTGEVYNIGGGTELSNIDVAKTVLRLMGKPESLIKLVADRPAHDLRYAIDCSKINQAWGWSSETDFTTGIEKTIDWYRKNDEWVKDVKDDSYLSYYERHYTNRDQTLASYKERS